MSVIGQLVTGTLICAICALLQLMVVATGLRRIDSASPEQRLKLTAAAVLVILAAHLIQIAIWAVVFGVVGQFDSAEAAIYFAITSYTTLGIGDVVMDESFRVLGALAAVAGLIAFGISTAFLFGALAELVRSNK